MIENDTTITEENVYEKSQQWLEETSRHDLLEYLYETCSQDFIKNNLVQEMVTWMGDEDFREFFIHLASCLLYTSPSPRD